MSEKNGIVELGVERGSVQSVSQSNSDVELFIEPLYYEPLYEAPDEDTDEGDVLPDELAELEVSRIYYESTGVGSFFLHNGNGTQIGDSYSYTANQGKFERGGQKMGLGNRVCASVTITSGGPLKIWVEVLCRRPNYRKRAIQYPDA
jgi:hypothetical protein